MSAMKWISKGLRNLVVGGGGATSTVPPVLLQSRLPNPPLAGTQAAAGVTVPPKPKRPMTPYFRFLSEVRPEVVKKNPNLKPSALDSQTKTAYSNSFKNEMKSFQTVLEKYDKSLTPEQKEAQEQLKISKEMRKEKIEKKRRVAELGKPKRPASPFLQFLQSKVPPGSAMKEHTATAQKYGPIWKDTMSDEDKAPFTANYTRQMVEYEKSLLKWENEMMKLGNDDLVRVSKMKDQPKSASPAKKRA